MGRTNISSFVLACIVLTGCSENRKQNDQPRAIYPPEKELTRLITSTRDSVLSTYKIAGFIFKYGVDARNVFNSFTGTYTLLADTGTSPSIKLRLSANEVDSVFSIMSGIGFFDFPDTFAYVSTGGNFSSIAGSGSAVYFGVRYPVSGELRQKELWWIDHAYSERGHVDERAMQLRQLILRTRMILEEKPIVKSMARPFRFQRFD
jgi:hypothetical protein